MLEGKIKNLSKLKKIASGLKAKGKRIVFTNGCFDLLHYGHAKLLQEAKAKGDILVVGLNSDSSLKRLKGKKRPIISQRERAKLLAALASVDFVTIFKEDTPLRLIKSLKPDILVKGADWNQANIVGGEFVRSYGGKVCTIRLIKGLSSSNIIKEILKSNVDTAKTQKSAKTQRNLR